MNVDYLDLEKYRGIQQGHFYLSLPLPIHPPPEVMGLNKDSILNFWGAQQFSAF